MAQVEVHGGDLSGGRIHQLRVQMHRLPARTIDRATAIAWMKDGHSLVPVLAGERAPALQLVEVGEPAEWFIRADNQPTTEDALPALPSVASAGR